MSANLENCQLSGQPGDPLLPTRTVRFLLPLNAELDKVTVSLKTPLFEPITETLDIMPAPPAAYPIEGGKDILDWGPADPALIKNGRNIKTYSADVLQPRKMVKITGRGRFHDWNIVEVRLTLMRYNPVGKNAAILQGGQVLLEAELNKISSARNFAKTENPTRYQLEQLQALTVNSEDLATFYPDADAKGNITAAAAGASPWARTMAIITTDNIYHKSSQLVNYIAFKESKGYNVRVVTESCGQDANHYETGGTGPRRALQIRSWLLE